MKHSFLILVLAFALAGCSDAYDDIADACQSNSVVSKLAAEQREVFCGCVAEEARKKSYPEDVLKAFAGKWRGQEPKNVSAMVQGEWFLFQLRCIRETGVKL